MGDFKVLFEDDRDVRAFADAFIAGRLKEVEFGEDHAKTLQSWEISVRRDMTTEQ